MKEKYQIHNLFTVFCMHKLNVYLNYLLNFSIINYANNEVEMKPNR